MGWSTAGARASRKKAAAREPVAAEAEERRKRKEGPVAVAAASFSSSSTEVREWKEGKCSKPPMGSEGWIRWPPGGQRAIDELSLLSL